MNFYEILSFVLHNKMRYFRPFSADCVIAGTGLVYLSLSRIRVAAILTENTEEETGHGMIAITAIALGIGGLIGLTYVLSPPHLPAAQMLGSRCISVADESTSVGSHHDFTARFYGAIAAQDTDANVLISPMSLGSAAALLSLGASGETLKEILSAFSLPCEQRNLLAGFKDLSTGNMDENVTFETANALFVEQSFPLKADLTDKASEYFSADITSVDFAGDSQGATDTINNWVSRKTREKIKKLFESLKNSTVLVVANAVYFKGTWLREFDPEMTEKGTFYGSVSNKDVQFMKSKENMPYGKLGNIAQFVRLDYVGKRMAMYVILPNDDVEDLEDAILSDSGILQDLDSKLRHADVVLKMPKFKLEITADLKAIVPALGAESMFILGKADFGEMTNDPSLNKMLVVSEAVQKTYIEVSEEGTEAAGVTGFGVVLLSAYYEPDPIIHFTCDRPFLFLIRDRETGSTLFMGKYADPPDDD